MGFEVLDFKCALVTGGGGGIGNAVAEYFLSKGKKVIICGRTESKLQDAVKSMKGAHYYVLDTGDIPNINSFVQKLTKEHPDLDCLVNNAGVQRPLSVNDMDASEFLEKADQEIDINIRGPMHLILNLLPHFRSKSGAVIMNVSSVLGYLPSSIINPVYNGTKAWQHFWSMNLRTQLAQATSSSGSTIRVVEIVPPTVSTELHRERSDPDDNKKDKNPEALSIEEFMNDFREALESGRDVVPAGPGKKVVGSWYETFGEQYAKAEGKK